jgi:tRNA(Ile2) C34 agmatinyltransferase TiaS
MLFTIYQPVRTVVCPDCQQPFETKARNQVVRCPVCRRKSDKARYQAWKQAHRQQRTCALPAPTPTRGVKAEG